MDAIPVIIEVALNGLTSPQTNPLVPITPGELAADAIECVDAGAVIVHTHADNMGAPPADLAERYAQCYRAVLAERPDTILYPTVGLGPDTATRFEHVAVLAAEGLIRQTFLDPGSVNLGGVGPDGLPPDYDFVYTNTFRDTRFAMALARDLDLGPSIACFEPGFLQVVLAYAEADALPPGSLVKLYFAAGGYITPGRALWGAPPIAEALDLYLAMLDGSGLRWAVAVVGGSLFDGPVLDAALSRGGHVRVGLEDDPTGPTNAEQVRRVVERIEAAGRRVATPAETAEFLW